MQYKYFSTTDNKRIYHIRAISCSPANNCVPPSPAVNSKPLFTLCLHKGSSVHCASVHKGCFTVQNNCASLPLLASLESTVQEAAAIVHSMPLRGLLCAMCLSHNRVASLCRTIARCQPLWKALCKRRQKHQQQQMFSSNFFSATCPLPAIVWLQHHL